MESNHNFKSAGISGRLSPSGIAFITSNTFTFVIHCLEIAIARTKPTTNKLNSDL
jgi:hypothetical protein